MAVPLDTATTVSALRAAAMAPAAGYDDCGCPPSHGYVEDSHGVGSCVAGEVTTVEEANACEDESLLTGVYPLHLACESGYEGLGRVECRASGEDFVFTGCTLSATTEEESSNIVVWLFVGIGVVAAGGLARNKPWQKGKQKHWIEQIERFTPAEMKANVSTPPARLPRLVFPPDCSLCVV